MASDLSSYMQSELLGHLRQPLARNVEMALCFTIWSCVVWATAQGTEPYTRAAPWLRRLVAGFDPGSVRVGFVVGKVALGQFFPQVLRFSPVNFIPPVLHYMGKQRCTVSLCCGALHKKNCTHAYVCVCVCARAPKRDPIVSSTRTDLSKTETAQQPTVAVIVSYLFFISLKQRSKLICPSLWKLAAGMT
jgi:hypothetical protein